MFVGTDDLDAARDGKIYVAGDIAGAIYQVTPETGAVCAIAEGLNPPGPVRMPPYGPTSVRILPDGTDWALYATSIDGTLRRLRPPPDVDLTPAHHGP